MWPPVVAALLGLVLAAVWLSLPTVWARQRRRDDLAGRTEAGPQ